MRHAYDLLMIFVESFEILATFFDYFRFFDYKNLMAVGRLAGLVVDGCMAWGS